MRVLGTRGGILPPGPTVTSAPVHPKACKSRITQPQALHSPAIRGRATRSAAALIVWESLGMAGGGGGLRRAADLLVAASSWSRPAG